MEDDCESEKSKYNESYTDMDDLTSANEMRDRDLVIDASIDSGAEIRDKCGMVIALSQDNSIMVESLMDNLSSKDNKITSDEKRIESDQ